MVETADTELFNKIQKDTFKKSFEDIEPDDIFGKKPLIYCHFASGWFLISVFLQIFVLIFNIDNCVKTCHVF